MEGDRDQCLRAGMDDYLSKPFSRVQLMEMLNEWCDGHANGAPPPVTAEAAAEIVNEESCSLDPAALHNIRSLQQLGRPDILGKVIDLFLGDCPGVMNRLRLAIESADAEQVRQNAHRLKSGSANLGATRMAELCRELEQLGRSGTLGDAAALLARVETEFRQVVAALQAERSRGAA
jgi:HPt (histidine-containing phosphotransfer) domain-containing protein